MPLVARVVVENAAQSFDKIYSYRVPEGMPVRPGCRVTAPFGAGNRTRFGLAVAVEEEPDAAGLKPLATLVDPEPLLSDKLLSLVFWLRDNTFCTYFDAVKALLAAGYRRPLCLHLPASQPATIRRRRGLERACREAGIEPDHLSHSYMGQGDEHYHDIPAVVLAHIREGKPGFDSVICGNDRIAFMVYQTLLGQGLRIPQDVAVVGYDNMVGIGDLFLPPLSTVQLPHYDIGRLSALHIIHGDNHRETRKVASPWLPRASH